jgi:hypothetical protein
MQTNPGDTVAGRSRLAQADELEAQGRWLDAIEVLTEENRRQRDPAVEERLARVRHRAYEQVRGEQGLEVWPPPADDLFPGVVGPPEVPASELTTELLRSGIANHGSLLVRGLLSPARVAQLVDDIDRAFDGYDANEDGAPLSETTPWFVPMETASGFAMDPIEQMLLRKAGGVHTGDSPRALFDLLDALDEVGLIDVVRSHFGETPLTSLNKGVLRKVLEANPTWHQDGCYLGEDIHAVNLWIALTDCGGDTQAPGLDMMPTRIGRLLPGGTHGAVHPQAIGHAVVMEAGDGLEWTRPYFAAGDAILFDQVYVHSTDKREGLTDLRYAIETWFFTPSTFPDNQIPIVV